MKKLLFLGVITASLFADTLINPSDLPQNIKDFVKAHYANENILKAEKDWDSYEIKLSNGAELDFTKSGELREIDGKYNPIPDTILSELTKAAKDSQKDAKLMEIERNWSGYELKFSNNYEVNIDKNGKILNTRFDD